MATFAFLVAPLRGHVNPTLAVAGELVAAGHRVVYWLPEAFRADVGGTGAAFHAYRPPAGSRWLQAPDPLSRFAMIPAWLAADSEDVLPQILGGLEAERPDVVVYDVLCVWGRLAAEILPLPAVMLCTSYAMNERFSLFATPQYRALPPSFEAIDMFLGAMRRLHARYGVALDLSALFHHAEPLTVVFVTRSFHPAAEAFDGRYRFVGPSLRPGTAADPLLAELAERPTVYVSMGTVFNDWPELLPACTRAFQDGRWQAVVAAGDLAAGADAAGAGPVRVLPAVPQVELLGRTDVFVTHGGMNSVMEALSQRVPMVVVPQTPEQAVTADRVAALGLGVRLDRAATTPAALREAVEGVAAAAEVRRAVDRLGQDARVAGGGRAAADALQRYVQDAGKVRS